MTAIARLSRADRARLERERELGELAELMRERGLLASITGDGRLTVRKRVAGGLPTVLHLTVSAFDSGGDQR